MCHEILKEEDDEVESLEDDGAGDCATKAHLDDLLDEQNGNISAKLTSLTFNDNVNDDSVAGLNGNTIANDSNRISATKMKKKAKKGTNSINAGGKLSTSIECDSNDNKLDADEGSDVSALEASDDRLAVSDDLIKDDAVNVHA